MKALVTALCLLSSAPAWAGPHLEFDLEATVFEEGAPKIFVYKHYYRAEFKDIEWQKGKVEQILLVQEDLPLRRPGRDEAIPDAYFGLTILAHPAEEGRPPYTVALDFGRHAPSEQDWRSLSVKQRDLHSLAELELDGPEVEFPSAAGGARAHALPKLTLTNVRYLD